MKGMPLGTIVDTSSIFLSYALALPTEPSRRVRQAEVMMSANIGARVRDQGTLAGVYSVRGDYTFEYSDASS